MRPHVSALLLTIAAAFAARSTTLPDLVSIASPLDGAVAPKEIAATWQRLELPMAKYAVARPLVMSGQLPSEGRVDVFVRRNGRWEWSAAAPFIAHTPVIDGTAVDARIGVLARFPEMAAYAWGEVDGASTAPVLLRRFKTLVIAPPDATRAVTIGVYSTASDTPQVTVVRGATATIPFVPASPAFVCGTADDGRVFSTSLPADESRVALHPITSGHVLRIARTPPVATTVTAIVPHLSALRPRIVPVVATPFGQWLLLDIDAEGREDIALDFHVEGHALQRALLADLAPMPAVATIDPPAEHGLTVRAALRGIDIPIERTAILVALPQATGAAERLPLAQAALDPDGLFRFPELGAATYSLKLLSSLASKHFIHATLTTGDPTRVTFDSGPLVKGKLVLRAGGTVSDAPRVDIVRVGDESQTAGAPTQGSDLADWIHSAAIMEDGSFATVIELPGRYTLRARWGRGIATRDFTVKTPPEDLDLGSIILANAATLRGSLDDCAAGELRVMPAPDLANPTRLSFPDLKRVPLGVDGSFYVEGLAAGTWLLGGSCSGVSVLLDPGVVTLGDAQDVVIQAHRTDREPVLRIPRAEKP